MVFKTPPAFAICSSNSVLGLFAVPAHHPPPSITSPPSRPRPNRPPPRRRTASRCYATVASPQNDSTGSSKPPGRDGTCPPWPTCANPTPYDIFAIDKAAPYPKARFAELVKLYHPDKHAAAALDALPAQARLERYRLVVLANDVLSSPDKRRAYDAFGVGWHPPDEQLPRDIHEAYRRADKAWRRAPGNPAMNATWEDWERWHDRRENGERQQPVYMSNAGFAALVLAALAVGTVAQTTRMDNNSAYIVDKRQQHEANISEVLRRQGAATAGKGREERIERFLRERENLNYDFTPARLEPRQESNTK